jgi:16S rRNA (cytosine1402-N4)-methyltransferase
VAGSFVAAPRRLVELGLRADVVLADLGFSSNQMDDADRGLSFRREGPLDMRFDRTMGRSAADLVNEASEAELREIIREYGEERRAARVASKIVEARASGPIETTSRLASIVRGAVGGPRGSGPGRRIDPATRTFQALRIAVNDELGALGALLEAMERGVAMRSSDRSWLSGDARVGVISFHSLEDRMVKRSFGSLASRGLVEASEPVSPGEAEVARNPRSRSARLRVARSAGSDSDR